MQMIVMKGPGSFSLERLLAIFQCISYASDFYLEETNFDKKVEEDEEIGSTSDILMQLTSLCKANFIFKSSSCSIEGFARYRCAIDEKTALKVPLLCLIESIHHYFLLYLSLPNMMSFELVKAGGKEHKFSSLQVSLQRMSYLNTPVLTFMLTGLQLDTDRQVSTKLAKVDLF